MAIIVTSGWLALYRFNMTDDMLFRITKVIPAPVANIDGETVRFSDYLMLYRSSLISIERQSGDVDNEGSMDALRNQYMRTALTEAEKFAYALKLAKELEITVIDEEVAKELSVKGHFEKEFYVVFNISEIGEYTKNRYNDLRALQAIAPDKFKYCRYPIGIYLFSLQKCIAAELHL